MTIYSQFEILDAHMARFADGAHVLLLHADDDPIDPEALVRAAGLGEAEAADLHRRLSAGDEVLIALPVGRDVDDVSRFVRRYVGLLPPEDACPPTGRGYVNGKFVSFLNHEPIFRR